MCWLGFRVSGSLFFGNPRWHGATPGEVSGTLEVAVGEKNQHTPQLIFPCLFFHVPRSPEVPHDSLAKGICGLLRSLGPKPSSLWKAGVGVARRSRRDLCPFSLVLLEEGRVWSSKPFRFSGLRFRFVTFFLGLQRPGYQMSATSREVCPAPRQSPNKISCFYKISAHNAPLALLRCLASWQKQVWSSRQLDVFVPMLRLCQ